MNASATELQRSSGIVRLSFKRRGSSTVLGTLYQEGCYKARFPGVAVQHAAEAILINTSGGLTDGDSLSCLAAWEPDTTALITTQAAERIYRSRDSLATVRTQLTIGADATACWLPQETILFDGGRMDRQIDVDMSSGARLFAAESIVFGRTGMGEVTQSGRVRDRWRIRLDGKLVFADSLLFDDARDGHLAEHLAHRSVADEAHCMATLIYVGVDCAAKLDNVRDALRQCDVVAGASDLGPLVVARVLAKNSQAMRKTIAHVFEATQSARGDDRFNMPRVWYC